jgi:hypothetical protein
MTRVPRRPVQDKQQRKLPAREPGQLSPDALDNLARGPVGQQMFRDLLESYIEPIGSLEPTEAREQAFRVLFLTELFVALEEKLRQPR